MLDKLTVADFLPLIGSVFQVRVQPDVVLEFALVEAIASAYSPAPGQTRQPFSILFRGPVTPALSQGMVTLQSARLGQIEGLFIVPIRADAMGRYYQAVFG
jgi:hypothetical protein